MYGSNSMLYVRMGVTMLLMGIVYILFMAALSVYVTEIWILVTIMSVFLFIQYFYSEKLALKSMNAKTVSEEEYPELHSMVSRLSMQADVPKPTVAISSAPMMNAFAAGRNQKNATVCVTEELIKELTEEELEGVIAHEIAHIKNRDVAIMTIASFFSTIAFLIVRFGMYGNTRNNNMLLAILISLVVWVISTILLKALSRYREYVADRGAASITGNPLALASALQKISGTNSSVPKEDLREHSSMNAFYISSIDGGRITNLLSTHPKTEKRIQQLKDLSRDQHK